MARRLLLHPASPAVFIGWNKMRRCVIIAGADIRNYDVIRTYLRPDDFIIYCDSGLKHQTGLKADADLIIGDFDSHDNPYLPVETIVLPCEKDDTDTMAAVREADLRGFEDFLILGVFGERIDHTLANIYVLLWLKNRGKKVMAVDDYSEFEIISPGTSAYIDSIYPYFSILSIAGTAEGITIKNAKYPLENAVITSEYQFGVSNEPLPGQTAEVMLSKGYLLLVKDR